MDYKISNRVYELIAEAQENKPISGATIATYINQEEDTNLIDVDIRAIIKDLRYQGYWIVASNKGYYIGSRSSLENYITSREACIRRQRSIVKMMKQSLRGMEPEPRG